MSAVTRTLLPSRQSLRIRWETVLRAARGSGGGERGREASRRMGAIHPDRQCLQASGRSSAWQSAAFGTQRPAVRICAPRPSSRRLPDCFPDRLPRHPPVGRGQARAIPTNTLRDRQYVATRGTAKMAMYTTQKRRAATACSAAIRPLRGATTSRPLRERRRRGRGGESARYPTTTSSDVRATHDATTTAGVARVASHDLRITRVVGGCPRC